MKATKKNNENQCSCQPAGYSVGLKVNSAYAKLGYLDMSLFM